MAAVPTSCAENKEVPKAFTAKEDHSALTSIDPDPISLVFGYSHHSQEAHSVPVSFCFAVGTVCLFVCLFVCLSVFLSICCRVPGRSVFTEKHLSMSIFYCHISATEYNNKCLYTKQCLYKISISCNTDVPAQTV